jgi:hypothetical protein
MARLIVQFTLAAVILLCPVVSSESRAGNALDPAYRAQLFKSECSELVQERKEAIREKRVAFSPDISEADIECGSANQRAAALRTLSHPDFVTRIKKILKVQKYKETRLEWEDYISDITDEMDEDLQDGLLDENDVDEAENSICTIAQMTVWIAVLDALHPQ